MLYHCLHPGIYVIHENEEWMPPFREAFARAGVECGEICLTQGAVDLGSPPPEGVFWSRMSASCHTRGHVTSRDYGRALLLWLEQHGRRVVNGSQVLEFEVSKVRQYLALQGHGFDTPRTVAVFGRRDLLEAAADFTAPFITKHNQGGKGLGVRRFESHADFAAYVGGEEFEEPADGITLLQEYVRTREFFITRAEFIGGRFCCAVRVDTSAGSFELCPADACALPQAQAQALPELAGAACDLTRPGRFTLRRDITAATPLIRRLEDFLEAHRIEVAGVEFMETPDGRQVVYDINTNTNYNRAVEEELRAAGGRGAADEVAAFLASLLRGTELRAG